MKRLKLKILGRTLEHLGVQMYKQRAPAVAELVANAWDAGATRVCIHLPPADKYSEIGQAIRISDDGRGMSIEEVQDAYLVIGRNRRSHDGLEVGGRTLMGRKGIGKLAGFGIASRMVVETWRDHEGIRFVLDLTQLRGSENEVKDVSLEWSPMEKGAMATPSGTTVTLTDLRHVTPLDAAELRRALARRFGRSVRGAMAVQVDGEVIPDPTPELRMRYPDNGFNESKLPSGSVVRHWHGFSEKVISDKDSQGFVVLVNGRTAQAPPFFFNVESTASGQHATRYLVGEIEYDDLDQGVDDTDLISTDRTEIDWNADVVAGLQDWGQAYARRCLVECTKERSEALVNWASDDPELSERIEILDGPSKKQIQGFLRVLGSSSEPDERQRELAGSLVMAYEFRQFHDVIDDLEQASGDGESLAKVLSYLDSWDVLESRAVKEIVSGRLQIIDTFEKMLVNDAPETKSSVNPENLHDLIGSQPWILHPDWEVMVEEKGITKMLREWADSEMSLVDPEDRSRIDFLALDGGGKIVIIEIKRADHAATYDEISRLGKYRDKISLSRSCPIQMVLVCGRNPAISLQELKTWKDADDREIRFWSEIFTPTKLAYRRYSQILEGNLEDAKKEAKATKRMFERGGIWRTPAERKSGVPEAPPLPPATGS